MARRDSFRLTLTLAGGAYLLFLGALLVIVLIQRLNLLTLFFALAVTPFLVAIWQAWSNVRRLEARALVPREVFAGVVFPLELEIENRSRWRHGLALVARVELARDSAHAPNLARGEAALPAVWPKGQVRGRASLGPLARGAYSIRAIEIASRFPFGFIEGRVSKPQSDQVLIFPRLGALVGRLPAQPFSGPETSPRRTAFQTSQLDEYRHLREYRPGDNPRHVHWRSSARRGELMVKEFEPDGTNPTMLVLDPWLPAGAAQDQVDAVEFLISFAATLCVDAARTGRERLVVGIAGTRQAVVESSSGQRWLTSCLEELARIRPGDGSDVGACVAELARRRRATAGLWILSTRPAPALEELAAALERAAAAAGSPRTVRPRWLGVAEVEKIFTPAMPGDGKTETTAREHVSA